MECSIVHIHDNGTRLYQSKWINSEIWGLNKPIFVVQADEFHCDHRSINHAKGFIGVLSLNFLDTPTCIPNHQTGNALGPLTDIELSACVSVIDIYLRSGCNVLVHCAGGVSRSSYITIAYLMTHLGMQYDEALAYLRLNRPQAQPNPGFEEHLRRWVSLD